MARRDEGCAAIGCLGICFLAVVGITGSRLDWGGNGRGESVPIDPPATTAPANTRPRLPPVAPPVIVEDLRRPSEPRELHIGPRGGCYYITDSGDRKYVDHSECRRAGASADPRPLVSPGVSGAESPPGDSDGTSIAPQPLVSPGSGVPDAEAPPSDGAGTSVAPQPLLSTGSGFSGDGSPSTGGSRQLHVGSRGGCYYISDSGQKEYVDRAECRRAGASAEPEPLTSPRSGSSGGGSRRSGSGRQLHVGPRGGCYYINGSGNKTYVDRSECH